MVNLPLSDASMSEVLARVSFRLIHYYHRVGPDRTNIPALSMSLCARWLDRNNLGVLAAWVYAYKRQHGPLFSTYDIREQFILDARRGYTWRRVVFPQYKSNRQPDPRVTNRGVRAGNAQEVE